MKWIYWLEFLCAACLVLSCWPLFSWQQVPSDFLDLNKTKNWIFVLYMTLNIVIMNSDFILNSDLIQLICCLWLSEEASVPPVCLFSLQPK